MLDPQTQGDVQWALGTAHDLGLEIRALREDAQRSCDGYMSQVVGELAAHSLSIAYLLRTLQAHVGQPPPPRAPVWELPTTRLAPIDDTDEPPTPPRRPH